MTPTTSRAKLPGPGRSVPHLVAEDFAEDVVLRHSGMQADRRASQRSGRQWAMQGDKPSVRIGGEQWEKQPHNTEEVVG